MHGGLGVPTHYPFFKSFALNAEVNFNVSDLTVATICVRAKCANLLMNERVRLSLRCHYAAKMMLL